MSDIERLAKEAGVTRNDSIWLIGDEITEVFTKFAALMANECAKVADTAATEDRDSLAQLVSPLERCTVLGAESQAKKIAAAIRAKFPMPKEPG
jgi:hypothetical protein